ncbi:MAG: peptide deformylase [Candidatus Devosia phytovorans]|uniref:Peptide deformylase-like n=1 Tax=Candidatus Devosia phytovorans TaxID=3121372 RepID=A0AAJ5VXR9_9HYPH|nr:peptide deformylase [Devosia sp.]WEK06115.1 MAG: peptide deformylase [Devosia sp.]
MVDFVIYPHAALSIKAEHRKIDASMLAAGKALLAAAIEVKAYGLAAAHLGLNEPVVVINMAEDPQRRDYRLLHNPEVIETAQETASGPEGSVSMPGVEVSVIRPVWAEIAYDAEDGTRIISRLEGFTARVALHEIDQMSGIFYLRRISHLKRDVVIRRFQKNRATIAV